MSRKKDPKNKNSSEYLQIAIDGTVAAGKGTVSRLIAERLGLLYVDTGAMYRCTALLILLNNLNDKDENEIIEELAKHTIELRMPTREEKDGRLVTVLLDGEDVSWKIRTQEVSTLSSVIAQHPKVRAELVRLQKEMAKNNDVIMEGRDITHTVLPDAQIKIYLDADPVTRAKRRLSELIGKGVDITLLAILEELKERDERDMIMNLKKVPGVWEIDTTNLSISEVVELITEKADQIASDF
jgi:CMP/dCMP kinase